MSGECFFIHNLSMCGMCGELSVCVRACVRACVRVCVRACVRVCVKNILRRCSEGTIYGSLAETTDE